MRLRTILIVANLALAGWAYYSLKLRPQRELAFVRENARAAEAQSEAKPTPEPQIVTVTNQVTWDQLESEDYRTYITRLRAINCPEQTIRDIIIAEINGLYSRRRALEVLTADQQWWRTEPDSNVVAAAEEKSRILDEERRALLSRLLGTNWESGDLVSLPRPSRRRPPWASVSGKRVSPAQRPLAQKRLQAENGLRGDKTRYVKARGPSQAQVGSTPIGPHLRWQTQQLLPRLM